MTVTNMGTTRRIFVPAVPAPASKVEGRILLIRGCRVLLDRVLADLYGVETSMLNKAVKRNRDRFPEDFMFQLTWEETRGLSRFQIGILKRGRNVKYRPFVFTEQDVAMLSSVLRSRRAVLVNVAIMRAFVRLRELAATHKDLGVKLAALEKKYDSQFRVVFDALRELMNPPKRQERDPIGFQPRGPAGAIPESGRSRT